MKNPKKSHAKANRRDRAKEDKRSSGPLVSGLPTITKEIELDDLEAGALGFKDGQLNQPGSVKQDREVSSASVLRYGVRDSPPAVIVLMGALQVGVLAVLAVV